MSEANLIDADTPSLRVVQVPDQSRAISLGCDACHARKTVRDAGAATAFFAVHPYSCDEQDMISL